MSGETAKVVKATAVAVGPTVPTSMPEPLGPLDICNVLAAWAVAADVDSPRAGKGYLAVGKSDLLGRLIYGRERGPSKTPCPVHEGRWSGCHYRWPGATWQNASGVVGPIEVDPRLQEWWDAGCRCATHRGSSCTTGWNPDENCCAAISQQDTDRAAR